MITPKKILSNLAILRYHAIKIKDYNDSSIAQYIENIYEYINQENSMNLEYINAINKQVNDDIIQLESIRDHEEETPMRKEQIDSLIQELHHILKLISLES